MTSTTREEAVEAIAPVTCTPDCSDVEDNGEVNEEHAKDDETSVHNNDDKASSDDDETTSIPEEFLCPLTLEIFTDPLMDKRGMNWERSAILEWLNRGNSTCPLTREPMGFRSLIPNVNLRTRVEHWKKEHGFELETKPKKKSYEQVVAYIEAPPDSRLEQRYMTARAQAILARMEREQARNSSATTSRSENSNNTTENSSQRRGRRRHSLRSSPTGYSPATQQRRLTGLLGEALSIVARRPPLASADD